MNKNLSAYRTLILNNGKRTENHRVLFDTGAQVNIISESHPILNDANICTKGQLKVKGVFDDKFSMVTQYCELNVSYVSMKETYCMGQRLRFWIVPNNANFGIILGLDDIQKYNITVGRKILIRDKNGVNEIKDCESKLFYDYGFSKDGSLRKYFIDHQYNGKNVAITNGDEDFLVVGNILTVPNNRKIDFENCEIWNGDCADIDEVCDILTEEFVFNVIKYNENLKLPEFDLNKITIGDQLTPEQKQKVIELLTEYQDIFSKGSHDIGRNKTLRFDFAVTSNDPQPAKMYRLSPEKQKLVHEEIKRLVQASVLEKAPQASVITSVFIPLKKPDGTIRLVSDFRAANTTILGSNIDIEKPNDILSRMANHQLYVQSDLVKAFFGLELVENKRHLLTCIDPLTGEKWQYATMPMGVKCSSQFFDNAAKILLYKDIPTEKYCHYIDDACLFGNNFDEMINLLRVFYENHRQAGFKINVKKSKFFVTEVKMLGYIVGIKGVTCDPKRAEDLRKLEVPKTKKQLQKSLGAIGYNRALIPNYAHVSSKLTNRLRKDYKFECNESLKKDWRELLDIFEKRVILTRPDWDTMFELICDASGHAIGAVLRQKQNNTDAIIGVYSYTLSQTEKQWETSARELFGIFKSVSHFKEFLVFRKFKIISDSKVNVLLLTGKANQVRVDEHGHSPAYKYLLYLSKFDFEIEHMSGVAKRFLLTDLLSRKNIDIENSYLQMGKNLRKPILFLKNLANGKYDALVDQAKVIGEIQIKVPTNNFVIIEKIRRGQMESRYIKSCLEKLDKNMSVNNGILYKKGKILCPPYMTIEVLSEIHVHGMATIDLFRKLDFYGIEIVDKIKMVKDFMKSCDLCQQIFTSVPKIPVDRTVRIVETINQQWNIDNFHFGKGKMVVLLILDQFSGFIRCKILERETGQVVKTALFEVMMDVGIPKVVRSDNGACFVCKEVSELFEMFNIHHSTISPSNSRANKAERAILAVQTQLRALQPEQDNVDDFRLALALAVFLINTRIPKGEKYSAYEKFFKESNEFMQQLPDLSVKKQESLNNQMRNAFLKTCEIRNSILEQKSEDLRNLESSIGCHSGLFQKGDLVKIKQVQKPGQIKKLFKPYSEKNYRVVKVLPSCNSLSIEEVNDNMRIRPNRTRVHMRRVKKVKSRKEMVEHYNMDHIVQTIGSSQRNENMEENVVEQLRIKQAPEQKSENTDNEFISDRRVETAILFGEDRMQLRPRTGNVNYKD